MVDSAVIRKALKQGTAASFLGTLCTLHGLFRPELWQNANYRRLINLCVNDPRAGDGKAAAEPAGGLDLFDAATGGLRECALESNLSAVQDLISYGAVDIRARPASVAQQGREGVQPFSRPPADSRSSAVQQT